MTDPTRVREYRQIRLPESSASVEITDGLVAVNYRPEASSCVTLRMEVGTSEPQDSPLEQLRNVNEFVGMGQCRSGQRAFEFSSMEAARRAIDVIRSVDSDTVVSLIGAAEDSLLRKVKQEAVNSDSRLCMICLEQGYILQLSACQHPVCDECVVKHATSGSKLQVVCPGQHCVQPLSLVDFDVAASGLARGPDEEFLRLSEKLTRTALKNLLHLAASEWAECKNEACDCIVKVEAFTPQNRRKNAALPWPETANCESCGFAYCMRCGNARHEDGCYENAVQLQLDEDPALREWHETDNWSYRRFCPVPRCCTSMEKSEGCNHMQCATCGTHFCWLCANFTASAESDLYGHLRTVHGNIGVLLPGRENERLQAQNEARLLMNSARETADAEDALQHLHEAMAVDRDGYAPVTRYEHDYVTAVPPEEQLTPEAWCIEYVEPVDPFDYDEPF